MIIDQPSLTNETTCSGDARGKISQFIGAILPLTFVIVGIGTMSLAPRKSSMRLFPSTREARSFHQDKHLPFSFNQPLVLVESNCSACDDLTKSLRHLRINFSERNVALSEGALALREQAGRVSGSSSLPMVIVGDQLINPTPYSVKVALRQLRRP